jgi:hypothetical protein
MNTTPTADLSRTKKTKNVFAPEAETHVTREIEYQRLQVLLNYSPRDTKQRILLMYLVCTVGPTARCPVARTSRATKIQVNEREKCVYCKNRRNTRSVTPDLP